MVTDGVIINVLSSGHIYKLVPVGQTHEGIVDEEKVVSTTLLVVV
jgi:hypothetical protein